MPQPDSIPSAQNVPPQTPRTPTPALCTGIILAAGNNERFQRHYGSDFVKQRLQIEKQPLLIRIMNQLESLGCSRLVIVAGNHAPALQELTASKYTGNARLTWVTNTSIERANGYSLHLGLQAWSQATNTDEKPDSKATKVAEPPQNTESSQNLASTSAKEPNTESYCHLVMSDHVYDEAFTKGVQEHLSNNLQGSTLFVDPKTDQIFDLDDATKVQHEHGHLVSLGKSLMSYNAIDTGWFILDKKCTEIAEALAQHQRQFGVSSVVEAYLKHYPFHCHSIDSGRWQDVDNPAMYEAAQELFS
jgi:1L-myo-inositol 1-phosphate cytidylyltransferase